MTLLHQGTSATNTSVAPYSIDYKGLPFSTGLTILTASGSAGDYTVIYE